MLPKHFRKKSKSEELSEFQHMNFKSKLDLMRQKFAPKWTKRLANPWLFLQYKVVRFSEIWDIWRLERVDFWNMNWITVSPVVLPEMLLKHFKKKIKIERGTKGGNELSYIWIPW